MNDLTLIAATPTDLPSAPFEGRRPVNGTWRASLDGATFERSSLARRSLVSRSAKGRASDGLEEFLEVKTVAMRIGRTRPNWVNAGRKAGAEG